MDFIIATLDIIGKVMVSYTAIMVHHRFWKEHKVDKAVFDEMRREKYIGIFGIICMIVSYILHIFPFIS